MLKRSMWMLALALLGIIPLPLVSRAQINAGGTVLYLPLIANGLPLPPPDEASVRLWVEPGFAIRIFAQNLPQRPRFMAFDPNGWLYVSLMNSGQIARLSDRNWDGLADGVEIVASGLNLPHGLEWHEGWLYVAEGDQIERLRDGDGNGDLEVRETVTKNIPAPQGHTSRTLHFGPDGKLYLSAGSSCNNCVEEDPRRAAILRFNPDGSIPSDNPFANDPHLRRPLWAWGLRNSVDFLWTLNGELWADHNGSDGLGDDLPPEEIVIPVQRGRWHGWPYCYTPGVGITTGPEVPDPRLTLPDGLRCEQAIPARFTALAHSAPLGMALGEGNLFPITYRNSLYVAYHGSWNTTPDNYRDCKIERILLDEQGQPIAARPFVNGWRAPGKPCGDAATWGRPADVAFSPRGEMFISDDKGNRIYRVIPLP